MKTFRMMTVVSAMAAAPLGVMALAAPALAQSSDHGDWSATLGAASDNRSKDASKTNGDPYAYGTVTWTSPSGLFYVAPIGFETIDSSTGSDLELQTYAGLKTKVAGFGLDLRAAYKYQTDANPGADEDAFEFTANLTRNFDRIQTRIQVQVSPDGTGSVRDWQWVEGRVGYEVTDRLVGSIAVGRREQDNSIDYTGWNAGFAYKATDAIDLDLRWYDTDVSNPTDQYAGQLVAAVAFKF